MSRFLALVSAAGVVLISSCSPLGGDLLTQSGKWCTTHKPGTKHDGDALTAKLNETFRGPKVDVSYMRDYVKSLDYEATAALYQIFSDFQGEATHVWYGSYSPTGRPGTDRAEGFRVIAKRTIKDSVGNPRLALVITFWTIKNGKLRLVGGPDSMRVRLQVGEDNRRNPRGQIYGLSYHLDVNSSGRVTGVKPTEFLTAAGDLPNTLPEMRMNAVFPTSGMDRCFYCHTQGNQRNNFGFSGKLKPGTDFNSDVRDDIVDETLVTPATHEGVKAFVNSFSTAERTKLEKTFETPKKTFFPEGLLESLAVKCNEAGTPSK